MHASGIIKIVVADKHKLVKESVINLLSSVPNFLVVDEAANGRELIEKSVMVDPDLIITNIELSPISGTEAVCDILKYNSNIRVLFFSNRVDNEQLIKVLRIGPFSTISMNIGVNEFVHAINLTMSGAIYFCREFAKAHEIVVRSNGENCEYQKLLNPLEQLSKREEEIVSLLASGLTTQQIAEKLFISKRTVDTHRLHIIQKFDLKSSADLFKFAFSYANQKQLDNKTN